jgi:hypothetical protein
MTTSTFILILGYFFDGEDLEWHRDQREKAIKKAGPISGGPWPINLPVVS